MTTPAPHNVPGFEPEPFAPVGTSRLYCICGRWSISIRDTDPWHWTISERLPRCSHRRWWNAWQHQSRTELPSLWPTKPKETDRP